MGVLKGLKICFIAGSLGQGGAERQLFYQLQALLQSGALPSVICLPNEEYWQATFVSMGIPVFRIDPSASRLARLAQVISILRQTKPQVVQAAHFYANLYAFAAARCLGLQEIGTIRSNGFQDVAETGRVSGRLSLWLPKELTVNSKAARSSLTKLGRSQAGVHYLPNVVDTERFFPLPQGPSHKDIHLIMVGHLCRPKRFDAFLTALAGLKQSSDKKIIGHIVGSGPDQDNLQALAAKLGLGPEHLCFHGAVADVERLYRQSDICLHLSDWEGLPNTILEAMACGLPVIASRVGGIPELVQEGRTGFLIDLEDGVGLKFRLQDLVEKENVRKELGRATRLFIEKSHALSGLPQILEEFYETVLNDRNP
jgi:glycosyltransferase involved in cell wall biosynthesis